MNERKKGGIRNKDIEEDFPCMTESAHGPKSHNRSQTIQTYFLALSQSI
jgi:hypothetical protein